MEQNKEKQNKMSAKLPLSSFYVGQPFLGMESVVGMLSKTQLKKNHFPFASRYLLKIVFGYMVNIVWLKPMQVFSMLP